MNILIAFIIAFIAIIVVTLLWNLIVVKSGAVIYWKTSFVFAIILGLVIPIVQSTGKTK